MIRAETDTGWILIKHADHALLAGRFAERWGNRDFPRPELFERVCRAVAHHDDGWITRDAELGLTAEGRPEAFTKTLVGAYSAFEEIDLPAYLAVRGEATRAAAALDPLAGVLISMHTVNLLGEQADLASIRPGHRKIHADFLAAQLAWQRETAAAHGFGEALLRRGFEFLQACDNLSLIACSGLDTPATLRHRHPNAAGGLVALACIPLGEGRWRVSPWPFEGESCVFELPYRRITGRRFATLADYRAAYAAGTDHTTTVEIVAG